MKTYKSILVQIVFLLLLSHLSFSQEVEVNLGGNTTNDAFVVRDSSGNVLLKMDGDRNLGINSEQPEGIEIIGRGTTIDGENGDPIKIIGGSTDPNNGNNGGSVSVIGGSGQDYGGSVNISSGYGHYSGNISIKTVLGSSQSGDINLRTGNASEPGHINLNTHFGNASTGSITLSTGQEYQPVNHDQGHITLATGWLGNIDLLSAREIQLKTLGGDYGSNIMFKTGDSELGSNSIWLTVGDDGYYGSSRGIILSPNGGVVEILGSGTYTGTWTQASDERYKNNIKPLLGILNGVNLLQPVEYEWNKEEYPEQNFPDGNQIGLIAQEVEKLFPEIVATNKDGYKSIDYSKISVLLLQAVKEQQNEIEKQSDEINKMKSDIEELKSMILNNSNNFSSNDNLFKED